MSEEFGGRLPTEILAERQRLPPGFLEQIIEYRAYARAWAMVDAADTPAARKALPRSEFVQMAQRFELEIQREDMDAEADGRTDD